MKYLFHILIWVSGLFLTTTPLLAAAGTTPDEQAGEFNVKEMILEHLADC